MEIDYRKELNKQQYEAVTTTEGPVLILAAAGSGKTRTLIYRVAYLIESGVSPENILLLTFTNRAADEMKERAEQMLDERCRKITACTYHSFCAKILRKYSRLIGIIPNFTIIDGNDAADIISMLKTERNYHKSRGFPKSSQIVSIISASVNRNWSIARAVDKLCRRYGGYVKQIEELEKAFIEYKKKNGMMDYDDLLVHMLTILRNYPSVRDYLSEAYHYIMVDEYQDTNYLQEQIVFALREKNRNLAVVGDDFQCFPKGTPVMTGDGEKKIEDIHTGELVTCAGGHGILQNGVVENVHKKPYAGMLIKIATEKGRMLTVTPTHTLFTVWENRQASYKDIYYPIKTARLTLFGGKERYASNNYHGFEHKLEYIVEERKKTHHHEVVSSSCDDLDEIGSMICSTEPDVTFIKTAILDSSLCEYRFTLAEMVEPGMKVCISENGCLIQDTVSSISQEYYEGFVYDVNISGYRNYIASGIVVHNCIYGFRGSNVQNIITFPEKMPGCRKICLTKNYRSNQEILDLSNHVMKENATEGFYKEMEGTYHADTVPQIIHTADSSSEARYIIGEIMRHQSEGGSLSNICVLIRNSFQSFELERLLNTHKIPFEKYGGLKFFDKAHVKDILAYVRCLVNHKDEIAWYRILQLLPGIGKTYSRRISAVCHEKGMEALIDGTYERRRFYGELTGLHEHLVRMENIEFENLLTELIQYYYELCKRTIEEMNTTEENRQELLYQNEFNREELNILIEMSKSYTSPVDFITDLSLDSGGNEKESGKGKLIISTIHSAKGLEFETVFMMDCIDEVCPSTTADEYGTESDSEELRCFYVAMTRAKKSLYLLVPAVMSKYGQIIPGRLAHYLGRTKEFCNERYI